MLVDALTCSRMWMPEQGVFEDADDNQASLHFSPLHFNMRDPGLVVVGLRTTYPIPLGTSAMAHIQELFVLKPHVF